VAHGGAHHHSVQGKRYPSQHGADQNDANPGGNMDYSYNTDEAGQHTHALTGGDSETRPNTYAVNYYIKIKKTPDPVLPAGPVGPVGPAGPAGTSVKVWQGTQTAYDSIVAKDPETLYLIDKP
jgi:hypothetical protein